jgi:hypothetical protein
MFTSRIYFTYQIGDWVQKNGLPNHHLRITDIIGGAYGPRWYQVFDTTLSRGEANYEWVPADDLERNSTLVARAENAAHARAILWRCQATCGLKYSIPRQQDCESLQRFIHTGREQDRWSPQVGLGMAAAMVLGLVLLD